MITFNSMEDFNLSVGKFGVHHGGEGSVYNYENKLAIKIFNPEEVNLVKKEAKIERFINSTIPSLDEIVTPIETVLINGQFMGYTMKFISNSVGLARIVDELNLDKKKLKRSLRIMLRIARCVDEIHKHGFIIGDFHPGQILVQGEKIYFVDADTWGIATQNEKFKPDLKCVPLYVDPKCRDFSSKDVVLRYYSKETDYYSLAVIAFEVLTGEHPFKGIYKIVDKMSIELRARNEISVLGNHDIKLFKGRTWENWMTEELKNAFLDIFERGKRYNIKEALENQLFMLEFCDEHGYYSKEYTACPVCYNVQKEKVIRNIEGDFNANLIVSGVNIEKVYDYRTFLNKFGEIVRINENGEEVRKIEKYLGRKETYFFNNEHFTVRITPLNILDKIITGEFSSNACIAIIYENDREICRFDIEDRRHLKIYENAMFFVDEKKYVLVNVRIVNGKIEEYESDEQNNEFKYVIGSTSEYAIISQSQMGFEIDIKGKHTAFKNQIPLIMRYDSISKMWLLVTKTSSNRYNTFLFKKRKIVFDTEGINYENLNLNGSVFYHSTLCIPGDGKMITIMPYVENMPFINTVKEVMIDVIDSASRLELKSIDDQKSELYVITGNNDVYRFVI